MFSGIVEEQGSIKACEPAGFVITASNVLADLAEKDSIAVDGTCLTVTALGPDWFHVDTIPETLRCTALGRLQVGSPVNLERSLPVNGRIGGHMVQGHVEASVEILSVQPDGSGQLVEIALPAHLQPFVVAKGFIALNGVSLTIAATSEDRFSIALIPYTREHTNLGQARPGMWLNLETDILGRYVARLLQFPQFQH